MRHIFLQLLNVSRVRDVTGIIATLAATRPISWKYVGDTENNLATINLGSDPASGLVERVTNAFDAVLELEWLRRGQPEDVISPRDAAHKWFGITEGKLQNVNDLRDPSLSALADRVQVIFHDSERPDRPTVDIRDTGVGIRSADFSSSILSLHKSRKLRKLFLAGAFGQGGSSALSYSPYTIIISRPAKVSRKVSQKEAEVSFTIVRFNAGDPERDKHGVYEYLVDRETGTPLCLPVSDKEFSPGTLVRHISMELGKYRNIVTAPTNSPWFLMHNYLFDPVLPFRLVEQRENNAKGERRAIAGNFRLLSRGEHTEYQRSAQLTFRSGTVSITWWVLSALGESARGRITQYVSPSKPIIVTYNGQKQGDFPNSIIKNDLRLPYLDRYLVVHVDCDQLDSESRRQLFPTTRESLRDTPIGDDLRRLIVDTLNNDPELQCLDDDRKRRYLYRADSTGLEVVRRRLGNRIKAALKPPHHRQNSYETSPDNRVTVEAQRSLKIQEPPQVLEITGIALKKVQAGARFSVRFRSDADPAYFMNPDTFVASVTPPSFAVYSGTTSIRDGNGIAYFTASSTLNAGDHAVIILEIRPTGSESVSASIEVEALPVQSIDAPGPQDNTINVHPHWVNEGDVFWRDNGWDRRSVAKVIQAKDSVDIFVSSSNERLASLIARAQRRGTEAVDAVKEFYLEHISFHAFLESQSQTESQTRNPEGSERNVGPRSELERVCETLCGTAETFFEVLVAGSSDTPDEPMSLEVA